MSSGGCVQERCNRSSILHGSGASRLTSGRLSLSVGNAETYTGWCTAFLNADHSHVLPAVSLIKALLKVGGIVTHHRTQWLLAAVWIAASLVVFLAIDASSTRSWIYLAAAALLPPIVVIRLWPSPPQPTVDDVIHGRSAQS